MKQFSLPIQISKVQVTENIDVHIISDDLFPNGTKQRTVISFFTRPNPISRAMTKIQCEGDLSLYDFFCLPNSIRIASKFLQQEEQYGPWGCALAL